MFFQRFDTSKIISQLKVLARADTNIGDLLQQEHRKIRAEFGWENLQINISKTA